MVAGSTPLSVVGSRALTITEQQGSSVRTEGLRVQLEARTLLDGVTTAFERNRITAIVGPTGCGKTTLLRAINRLHDHTPGMRVSGTVTVDDDNVYDRDIDVRALRRRVGMLFQRPNPFPQSIADNVGLAPRAHGLGRRDVAEMVEVRLREVGLWAAVADRLDQSPFSLSGGQQQLLCLARALALSPKVLLLDEPASALDPRTTEHIEELLQRLSRRMTILIVTHNLAQASRISDQVTFLMAGKLVESAPSHKFFGDADDQRSRAYVSGRIG